MSAAQDDPRAEVEAGDVAALMPMVRRIVGARVGAHPASEDLVQETLARVLAASSTIEDGMLEPYAIVTARNVVATMWRDEDRRKRNVHRVLDLSQPESPDDQLLLSEEQSAVVQALAHLSEREREALLAHEVAGQGTRTLADETGSTPGAIAAQLNRTRARMRVEYLLALEQIEPPTDKCRPVLYAISGGDRRRQKEVDAARHVLECRLCGRLSEPLTGRGQSRDDELRVPIATDADIVAARRAAREMAKRVGFGGTDLTIIATAVSEVSRNIVRFAGQGEVVFELLKEPRQGLLVVARDSGPGIPDVQQALQNGYSTYRGLGLGLPGARRLMDEFAIVSEPGHGTTVTMTKWQKG
ncbi:sigma-70 family RNA polymerase sigma factor [Monashia sp. NPDC004114]